MEFAKKTMKKNLYKIFAVAVAAVMLFAMAGCNGGSTTTVTNTTTVTKTTTVTVTNTDTTKDPTTTVAPPPVEPATRTIVDMDGIEVEVPYHITSYFNGYPVSNGVMVLLGVQDAQMYYLDRVTRPNWAWLREFNPLINQRTIIGNDATVTVEELLNTDAQVVIISNKATAQSYREAGLTVFSVTAGNTIEGFWNSVKKSAELFGDEAMARADAYVDYAKEIKEMVEKRVASIPENERPSVYYISGGVTPYNTSKGGNYSEEYIAIGGGYLCTAGGVITGNTITAEQLLEIDPDYIIVGTNNRNPAYEALMADEALAGLSAIKNGKVVKTPQGTLPWDTLGPEIAMMPVFVGKTLHPELFEDIDLKELMTDFYKKFYNYELSDEYADLMLAGVMGPQA